jgi:YebC/PmpR family DNA-binding regulatory protein
MSGHNKWSSIKHKKGKADAKRGQVFTKVIKELTVAARFGGGDPEGNPRLRSALAAAKAANMPADNIKRAIQKGTGELPGVTYEEGTYEGYGPGGVAIIIEVLTDNKNRTTPEIRHLFDKHGGNLGAVNSVAWMFDRKGYFLVPNTAIAEDDLIELVLEAGGDDVQADEENFEVFTSPEAFPDVQAALEVKGVQTVEALLSMIPQNTVEVSGKKAMKVIRILELFEDHEDVQNVFANFDIDESQLN